MLMPRFNLAALSAYPNPQRVAHLAIDVQPRYVMNELDRGIADHISLSVAPRCAARGISTYWIYNTCAGAALHSAVKPSHADSIFKKDEPSAMTAKPLVQKLESRRTEWLLVSGFTFTDCITDTILMGIDMGYRVTLLQDATDYDDAFKEGLELLVRRGAVIQSSDATLSAFECR